MRPAILVMEWQRGRTLDQMKVMAAEHSMYDDFARRTLTFFDAHRGRHPALTRRPETAD